MFDNALRFRTVRRRPLLASDDDQLVATIANRESLILARRGMSTCSPQSAGTLLFLPLLAEIEFDSLVHQAIRFADYWKDLTESNPESLYFASWLTTYSELLELNFRMVFFGIIHRHGLAILKRLEQMARTANGNISASTFPDVTIGGSNIWVSKFGWRVTRIRFVTVTSHFW